VEPLDRGGVLGLLAEEKGPLKGSAEGERVSSSKFVVVKWEEPDLVFLGAGIVELLCCKEEGLELMGKGVVDRPLDESPLPCR
jgi:hypothetical protein